MEDSLQPGSRQGQLLIPWIYLRESDLLPARFAQISSGIARMHQKGLSQKVFGTSPRNLSVVPGSYCPKTAARHLQKKNTSAERQYRETAVSAAAEAVRQEESQPEPLQEVVSAYCSSYRL